MSHHHRDASDETPTDIPMTPLEISRTLRKMEKAMFGDRYNPSENPGFFAILLDLHKDYYGDKKTGRMGTKDMVLRLWEMRIKLVAICGAVVVLAKAAEMFITYKR